jgi:diguanylate cyclase (GGDEF)-like protein
MLLYALDAEVERLHAELPELTGTERIEMLVTLAWYLRQRDSQHALVLADEAVALLNICAVLPDARRLFRARLALVRAEVAALLREFSVAEQCLQEARLLFSESLDKSGEGDALLVSSVLFLEQGDTRRAMHACQDAAVCFDLCADSERQFMAEGWNAYLNSFSLPDVTSASLLQFSAETTDVSHPALAALMSAAQGEISFSCEKARSSVLFNQSSELARQTGLIRLAIMSACNAGAALQKLGDFDGAALIYDWAVSRARASGWPAIIAFSLIRLGELLRDLNHLDRSQNVLREALQGLKDNKIGIHAAIANAELGNTLLSLGKASEAASYFDVAIQHCRETGSRSNLAEYLICQARALALAGKALAALDVIEEARVLISDSPDDLMQVDLREALAEIHHQHDLPVPLGISAPNVVLHFLEDAVSVGNAIDARQISAKLLLSLAEAWARAGEGQKAFEYAKQAIAADQRERSKQTENWATLMQVRHETETAKAVAIHHQQLSAASLETSLTLGLLGNIGQEITADLNFKNVCDSLQRHLGRLLNTENLYIWLIDPTHNALVLSYCVKDGVVISNDVVNIGWDVQAAASCIELGQELVLEAILANNDEEGAINNPKTSLTLFCPLIAEDTAFGVLAIQSSDVGSYSERQRLIFRSLCAYGAIALDNAQAHHELQATQIKLEQALLELKEASFTDPLTGLRNRRFLMQNIESDIALSIRHYQNMPLDFDNLPKDADLLFFLVDLDHFKQINDRYGHAAGDAILVQIRERLQKVFRDSDYLIRWGGEEFLVVARGTSREIAEELAERVRAIVADEEFNLEGGLLVRQTCSVGFACFPFVTAHPRAIGWKDVMDIADIALYAVKHAGRNGWMGLIAEEHVWPELLLCTLKADPKGAILNREVRLATNKAQDDILIGLAGKNTILLQ